MIGNLYKKSENVNCPLKETFVAILSEQQWFITNSDFTLENIDFFHGVFYEEIKTVLEMKK